MGSTVYGLGFYNGRRSVFEELRSAAAAANARQHSNRMNATATVVGAVIAQLIPVAVQTLKERKRPSSSPEAN